MAEILKESQILEACCQLNYHQKKSQLPSNDSQPADLNKKYEEAYNLGLMEGKALGFALGEELAKKEASQLLKQLNVLIANIPSALTESRHALISETADIVFAISQQFFIQQMTKEAIAEQISTLIQQLNEEQQLALILNPEDLQLLQEGQLEVNPSLFNSLQLIADQSLDLGGCRIKTRHGLFDFSIERKLENLKELLLKIKRSSNV